MDVICDIETDGLIRGRKIPSTIWCVVFHELDSGSRRLFVMPQVHRTEKFLAYASKINHWYGHNFIQFDARVLNFHFHGLVPFQRIRDTLVLSRLLNASIEGGHSLEAWGLRFGVPKIDFKDFSKLSIKMCRYALRDIEVNYLLYKYQERFWKDPAWSQAIRTEHDCAILCSEMSEHGFWFDIDTCLELHKEMSEELEELDRRIKASYPPYTSLVREIHPRVTVSGNLNLNDFRFIEKDENGARDLSGYGPWPFSLFEWVEFSPSSHKQMLEKLNEAGWRPTEKTKTHIQVERDLKFCRDKKQRALLEEKLKGFQETGWTISETNLRTLPDDAPEGARCLSQRVTLAARLSDLEEWLKAYDPETHRIHANFNHILPWTHRMSHQGPNLGNISSPFAGKVAVSPVERIKEKYDGRMRALFGVPPGSLQIGVDMDAAHLRILAHLMKDEAVGAAIDKGDKKNGTDIHTLNKTALGPKCKTRDDSKTFIYTWLNGGGAGKVSSILGCSVREASESLKQFTEFYPNLKRLMTTVIPEVAQRGFFEGLDGRKVIVKEERKCLAGMLQNAEKIILAETAWNTRNWLLEERLPAKIIILVHDEIQVELNSDNMDLAKRIGEYIAGQYTEVAEKYKLVCPFRGGISIGTNWADAH